MLRLRRVRRRAGLGRPRCRGCAAWLAATERPAGSSAPPQVGQRHPSTANTRHSSSAQVRFRVLRKGVDLFDRGARCGAGRRRSRNNLLAPCRAACEHAMAVDEVPTRWRNQRRQTLHELGRCERDAFSAIRPRALEGHSEEPGGGLFKTRPRERGSGQVPTQALPSPSVSPTNGDAAVQGVAAPACTPGRQRVRAPPINLEPTPASASRDSARFQWLWPMLQWLQSSRRSPV